MIYGPYNMDKYMLHCDHPMFDLKCSPCNFIYMIFKCDIVCNGGFVHDESGLNYARCHFNKEGFQIDDS